MLEKLLGKPPGLYLSSYRGFSREAVDLLIALINGRTGVDRRRVVQPVLVPRRSTGLSNSTG